MVYKWYILQKSGDYKLPTTLYKNLKRLLIILPSCIAIIISHEIRIPIDQPGFHGSCHVSFFPHVEKA